ncbi:MAG: phasin family protein [Anaerolineae bacterium]
MTKKLDKVQEAMAEKAEEVKDKAEKVMADVQEEVNPLFDAARRVVLAAIGAVALASDEVENFVNKLVERGEIAEKDGRKLLKEVTERTQKQMKPAEKEVEKRLENMLENLNIPSKTDIDALSEKVAELSQKVEALKN